MMVIDKGLQLPPSDTLSQHTQLPAASPATQPTRDSRKQSQHVGGGHSILGKVFRKGKSSGTESEPTKAYQIFIRIVWVLVPIVGTLLNSR